VIFAETRSRWHSSTEKHRDIEHDGKIEAVNLICLVKLGDRLQRQFLSLPFYFLSLFFGWKRLSDYFSTHHTGNDYSGLWLMGGTVLRPNRLTNKLGILTNPPHGHRESKSKVAADAYPSHHQQVHFGNVLHT
jgi:hypothetical protein